MRRLCSCAALLVLATAAPLAAGCSRNSDGTGSGTGTMSAETSLSASLGSSGSPGGPPAVETPGPPAPRGRVEVVRTLPHDPTLFTQGLQVVGDTVYESTGMYGRSGVLSYPLAGGAPTAQAALPAAQFGEGSALTTDGSTFWSLTWKDGIAYNRDPRTLAVRSQARYQGEGWGLCAQGDRLVMSDGSPTLTFRDPVTFAPTATVRVTNGGTPVARLNELDCAGDAVFANVWMTDDIVRIDPATGHVTAVYDASALKAGLDPRPANPDAVLNGIAALPGSSTFLVTGKYWPSMFEVRFVD